MAGDEADDVCEYELPAVEAVLAGTLALMTGFAQSRCAEQRRMMSNRIVGNMELLTQHPHLSGQFRCAMGKLRGHWEGLTGNCSDPGAKIMRRHCAPATLQ